MLAIITCGGLTAGCENRLLTRAAQSRKCYSHERKGVVADEVRD